MATWAVIAGGALIAVGLAFQAVAALGVLRFKDVYSRLHVIGILDTLGCPLVLLGCVVLSGAGLFSVKVLVAIGVLYATSPLVGHMLARAALESGIRPRRTIGRR